jgi:hypothetical protein
VPSAPAFTYCPKGASVRRKAGVESDSNPTIPAKLAHLRGIVVASRVSEGA